MLVAVCSVKGSPGVTTLAMALGARWPNGERAVVVEADPAGGDLVARFRRTDTPGLVTLAAAARSRPEGDLVGQHVQVLLGGLPVVLAPVAGQQVRSALQVLVAPSGPWLLRAAAQRPGVSVIVDCGRVEAGSPVLPIVREADVTLLVARPRDADLAHVAVRLCEAQRWSRRPCLVLVGEGYPTGEVSHALGIPVLARIPRDDRGAAVLGGLPGRQGPARSVLGRAAAGIAATIHSYAQAGTLPHGESGLVATALRPGVIA